MCSASSVVSSRSTVVTGPLGTPVDAVWRLAGDLR